MELHKYPVKEYARIIAMKSIKCSGCESAIFQGTACVTNGILHYHGRCAPRGNIVDIIDSIEDSEIHGGK